MPVEDNTSDLNKKQQQKEKEESIQIDHENVANENDLKNISDVALNISNTSLKRRLESLSDEEIIEQNLKELLERKSREERKANGRLIAVIVVFLVIFLAIHHIWTKQGTNLTSVLVPAVIMLSYGGWVVLLAKRDKQKQALFEKHLEDIVQKNKIELEEKAKLKQQEALEKRLQKKAAKAATKLYIQNERQTNPEIEIELVSNDPRKQRRYRAMRMDSTISSGYSTLSSTSSTSTASGSSIAQVRVKRPSIREKLFKQKAAHNIAEGMVRAVGPATTVTPFMAFEKSPPPPKRFTKKEHLQRLDDFPKPHMVRKKTLP